MKDNDNSKNILEIVDILQKKPDHRNAFDLKRLIMATEQIQFFDRYVEQGKEKVLEKCCRHMKYEAMGRGEKVFEIDERGTKFYLILSGKVGVYIKDPNQQINNNQTPKMSANQHSTIKSRDQSTEDVVSPRKQIKLAKEETIQSQNGQKTPNEKKFDPDDYFIQLRQKFSRPKKKDNIAQQESDKEIFEIHTPRNTNSMICVKQIESGNAFGELALLNNKPRLATIVCHENCQFAILEKQDFSKILKDIEEKLLDKEISLLANLHIFQGWNKNLLKQLYLNSQKVKFNRGQVIFKEGDACDNVYIVHQGEFTIYKVFEINRDQEQKDYIQLEFQQQDIVDQMNQVHGTQKSTESIPIKMSILTPFEMFGEEDFIQKQDRTYSVKCTSLQGQLIVIKNKNFNIRIFQDEYTKQYLYERLEKKKKAFEQRSQIIIQQYKQYKQYLMKSTDNLFDFCIEAIKKQSNEPTDYHQINISKSNSPLKQNDSQDQPSKKQNNNKQSDQKIQQEHNQQDDIHMLKKVLNYDLKYHRKSLQKGLLGMFNKEFKDMSIRKNQKEVNIEMQHYAQQFNQYETDKFINMNAQEEINNQEQVSKTTQEKDNINSMQNNKYQRSKPVSTLKNETRDQLLNQYRQIIYEQSSIHFKIKCYQAQKSKSDRSKIDYLQIMREKESNTQSPDKLVQKRRRAVSANSIKELQHNVSLKKTNQQKPKSNFSNFGCIKTEASPDKGLYRYYSYNPPNSRKSLTEDNDEEGQTQILIKNFESNQNENGFNQEKDEIVEEDKIYQVKINNLNNDKTRIQNNCQDENKFQLIKVYQYEQQKAKQGTVKQKQYLTNFFTGDQNQKVFKRSQSIQSLNTNSKNQEQKSVQCLLQKQKLNQKMRSSSVQNPFTDLIITNKMYPEGNTKNKSQQTEQLNENILKLNQIDSLKVNSFIQYQINVNKMEQPRVNQQSQPYLNSTSSEIQQRQQTQSLFQYVNNTNKNESREDQGLNQQHNNLQDQLRKPKWKCQKYDIIGNVKKFDNQVKKIQNQQKDIEVEQKLQESSKAFLIQKLGLKK